MCAWPTNCCAASATFRRPRHERQGNQPPPRPRPCRADGRHRQTDADRPAGGGHRHHSDRADRTRSVPAARPHRPGVPHRPGRLDPRPRHPAAAAGGGRIPAAPGHYQIIAGERQLAARPRPPGCTRCPVLVRSLEDADAMAATHWWKTCSGRTLNAIEEAEGYKRLLDEYGMTQETLAIAVGKISQPHRQHVAPVEPAPVRAAGGCATARSPRPRPRALLAHLRNRRRGRHRSDRGAA